MDDGERRFCVENGTRTAATSGQYKELSTKEKRSNLRNKNTSEYDEKNPETVFRKK